MRDLIEITLPRTQSKVWLKKELTVGEERKATEELLSDIKIDLAKVKEEGKSSVLNNMNILTALKSTDATMLISIDKAIDKEGNKIDVNQDWLMGLYKDDYQAIETSMKAKNEDNYETKKK